MAPKPNTQSSDHDDDTDALIDVDSDLDEDNDTDEAGDDDEEWTPPTKEQWERTEEALKKANAQAKKRRLEARKNGTGSGDTEADVEKARTEAEQVWKPRLVKALAASAFASAGAKNPSRLVKMLDLDEIDVTDDDELEGLDEQIDEIKSDYPELFGTEDPKTKRTRRINGSNRPPTNKTMTATERQLKGIGALS